MVDPEFVGLHARFREVVAADDHDWHVLATFDFAEAADKLETIHTRHAEIQQHDVRLLTAYAGKRRRSTKLCIAVETTEVEQGGHAVGSVGQVVHDENAGGETNHLNPSAVQEGLHGVDRPFLTVKT